MSFDDIVNPVIRLEDSGIAQPGFGVPLVCASLPSAVVTAWGPDRVRKYSSAAAAVADGLTTTTRAGKMVAKLFSQTPKPTEVWVGRRAIAQTQIITLTPTNTTVGYVYTGKVAGATSGTWTYTVLSGHATVPEIVAGIVSAITALGVSGCTAAAVGTPVTHLTCTSTAGLVLDYTDMCTGLTVVDSTADPGIATDLAAIALADNGWYFLLIDSTGQAENEAAAAWVETTYKQFVAQTADSACLTSATTTNVLHTLNALSYYRTSCWWNQDISANLACAIVGSRSTATPGSDTWALKNLSGVVPSDQLTDTEVGYLKADKGNYYRTIGTGRTLNGWVSGGEYCDTVRFLDWVRATMQVNCINDLASAEKVPNTDEGRQVISSAIQRTLVQGVKNKGFKAQPAPVVTMPPDTDATSFDAATRTLSGVSWTATLANAIHAINPITGYVSQ